MAGERKSYWEERMIQLYEAQDKKNAKFDKKMRKEYHRLEASIQKEVASYYTKYGKDNVIEYRNLVLALSPSERDLLYKNYEQFAEKYPQYMHLMPIRESIYQLNRLEGMQLNIRMHMVELGAFEQEGFENLLKEAYELGYLSTMKGLDNAQSFFSVNDIAMQQTLKEKWVKGKNFSDRIWDNKERLLTALNNDLRDGIIRGDSYQQIAKAIHYRTGVGGNDSLRLVVTESAFVMNQANKQAFMDTGIESYEVSAVMDRRTSPTCRGLDGQQFDFEDAKVGVNYPPFHVWCRTTTVPIENDRDNFIKSDEPDDYHKVYPPVKSNINWVEHLSIPKEVSDLLNTVHTELNEFMNVERREKLILLNKENYSIEHELTGVIDRVDLTKETIQVLKRAKPNSLIFIHNHPSPTPFSRDDIRIMIENKSISELTLECADGSKFLLLRNKFKSSLISKYFYDEKYDKIYWNVAKRFPELDVEETKILVWDEFMTEVNKEIALYYGMEFRKVK